MSVHTMYRSDFEVAARDFPGPDESPLLPLALLAVGRWITRLAFYGYFTSYTAPPSCTLPTIHLHPPHIACTE